MTTFIQQRLFACTANMWEPINMLNLSRKIYNRDEILRESTTQLHLRLKITYFHTIHKLLSFKHLRNKFQIAN